jgi:hypothetical protein
MMNRRNAIKSLAGSAAFCACHNRVFGQQELVADWRCSFNGEQFDDTIYTYASNEEAVTVVAKILKHTGLNQNFEIQAANVPNAMATIRGDKRYILYNQEFMRGIKNATKTDWSGTSILAHEIGHHLQGHTIQAGGSRPVIELEADKYSGFVLQRMGASIDQSKAAMEALGNDAGSSTHPKKRDRLVAIVAGWNEANELSGLKKTDVDEKPSTKPVDQPTIPERPGNTPPSQPNSTPNQPVSAQPVSRCVFNGDPNVYLVMSDNAIVSFNQAGQAVLIGRKVPPTMQGFAWMYQNNFTMFGVDGGGRIWGTNPFGQPVQIGYVTNP